MKFNLKNYLLGLGSGIIIMSLVFYCFYSFVYKNILDSKNNSNSEILISDEEIEKRAKEMGMIYIDDLPKNTN